MSIVEHGTEVFGSDARRLGTVSAVRRGCFEVQLSDRVAVSLRAERSSRSQTTE